LNCGKIDWVRTDYLNSYCKECGNKLKKKFPVQDDLTGKKFGYWKVLYKANKPNYWHCICTNCGTERDVFRGNLTQGFSTSCGCISSKGQFYLIKLFQKYDINFQTEFSFTDLVGKNNRKLRFDFAIFDKYNNLYCLVEFDGSQHRYYNKNWHTDYEKFLRIQELDQQKNEYCKNHNIKLFRLRSVDQLNNFIEKIIDGIKMERNND
jgi:hypothetical protein